MMRFLPHRGPMLGEAACYFDEAHLAFVKGLLRWDAAEFETSENVSAVVEYLAATARGATALADEYAREVAAAEKRRKRRRV